MKRSGGLQREEAGALGAMARRRAEWLLLGRLVLTSLSFAIGVGLEGPGVELVESGRTGLFWTVALAFGATAISATLVRRLRHLHRFAAVQIAIDVAIVTSLVYFSGGRESPFSFLYVLVTVYGALLFDRWGAMGAATLSAFFYAGVLLSGNASEGQGRISLGAVTAVWGVHVGALYFVGALASLLSRELRRTGQALDRRTEDLIRLKDLHERMVESLMSGLVTTDRAGSITYFNPEAERITGLDDADAVGRPLDAVIPGAYEVIRQPIARSSSQPSRTRMRYRSSAGKELHLGLAGSILRDENGAEAGHVLIFQDVTEVVAMEAQLRRSERLAAVGEMSAKMAHEIRNPLAAISGAVQVLRGGMGPDGVDPQRTRLMEIVVREADRLNGLIQDFLRYARPKAPVSEPVHLDALIADVMKLFESSLPEGVELCVPPLPPLVVQADPSQLRQVLWNLCLNAVQAMPEGGELRVSLAVPDCAPPQDLDSGRRNEDRGGPRASSSSSRWAEIAVADSGVGIPLEVQDQIFEPFFTTRKEGSGLGLATVHRIVESHGGMLQVESEQGRGTTFRVWLPRGEDDE
jgi:two-component system sensor histidine kinase PilS (NtrC family)